MPAVTSALGAQSDVSASCHSEAAGKAVSIVAFRLAEFQH